MKTILYLLLSIPFLLSLLCQISLAQSLPPEYGDISEIVNKRKVYIYTDDLEARDRMVKEINKYNGLEVVSKIDDSEMVILFAGAKVVTGAIYNPVSNTATQTHKELGEMRVVIPGSSPNALKIVWHAGKSTKFRFGKDPDIKCIQEFIKDLKKVRKEK
jgi:hypothetical protein